MKTNTFQYDSPPYLGIKVTCMCHGSGHNEQSVNVCCYLQSTCFQRIYACVRDCVCAFREEGHSGFMSQLDQLIVRDIRGIWLYSLLHCPVSGMFWPTVCKCGRLCVCCIPAYDNVYYVRITSVHILAALCVFVSLFQECVCFSFLYGATRLDVCVFVRMAVCVCLCKPAVTIITCNALSTNGFSHKLTGVFWVFLFSLFFYILLGFYCLKAS